MAGFSAVLSFWAGWQENAVMVQVGRRAFYAAAVMIVLAGAVLEWALLSHDFSLAYVAEHTDLATPTALVAAGFYGGQQGSLLYWALVLGLLGSASLVASANLGVRLAAYAAGVLAASVSFFLIVLGMWWAYHVLGWGGYWGWDPVENVALMPWLATTAYLHSSQVQEKRGRLRAWNFGLVILAFLLVVFGTFIVRSGVVQSVHTFAISAIGPWFLAFLFVCIVFSVVLLATRANQLGGRAEPTILVSREGAFALQNLLLIGVVAVVIWGTVLPLVSGMVGQQRVVSASYYERAAGPLLVVILALMAAGPLLPWGRAGRAQGAIYQDGRLRPYARALVWPGATALVVLVALALAGVRSMPALVALPFAAAVAATCITQFARLGWRWVLLPSMLRRRRRRYGAYLAHLGLAVLVTGIAASHFWQQEKDVTLAPGQQVTVAGYTPTYLRAVERPPAHHPPFVGGGRFRDVPPRPARATYAGLGGQSLTHVAISTTPLADVYVVMAGANADGSGSFRIFVNPLVTWIWACATIIIVGVVLGNVGERSAATEAVRRRIPAPVPS